MKLGSGFVLQGKNCIKHFAAQGRQLLEAASRLLEESRGGLGAVQVAAMVSAAGLTAAMPDRTAGTFPKLEQASRSFELRPDETLQQEVSTPRFARGAESSAGGQPGDEPVQVQIRALAGISSCPPRQYSCGIVSAQLAACRSLPASMATSLAERCSGQLL